VNTSTGSKSSTTSTVEVLADTWSPSKRSVKYEVDVDQSNS
jgi:hypothetical protein